MKVIAVFIILLSNSYAKEEKEAPKVFANQAKLETLNKKLNFPVVVRSKIDSKIISNTDQIVIKRIVNLGERVKAGQPLLTLRNQDLSLQYNNKTINAPVSGVVAAIFVRQGQYIKKGTPLVLINDPTQLYAHMEIPASDFSKIKTGMKGSLDIPNLGVKGIELEVSAIGATMDSLTGTVPVELAIKTNERKLIPGVLGRAEITLNKQEVLLVKEKSLYYIGDDILIATLEDGKVKKVPVTIGKRYKENIEILSGLDLGKTFITDSPKYLKEGEKVKVEKK
jgi:multidrug efflux pump subunit AcrA (membrane-fusion protein)